MKREPTAEEWEKIDRAITSGDRIEATSMYISITERGLTQAQEFIKARNVVRYLNRLASGAPAGIL